MLLTIAIVVCGWGLIVAGVLSLCAMAHRDEPRYAAAERMHALRRLSPGCPHESFAYVTGAHRARSRRRGARALR